MIKQDFISKYIQELAKTLAKIMALEIGNSDEGFLIIFNQMLQSYYKIDDNQMLILLEEDQQRDQFLLADELKKKNQLTFMKAIKVYVSNGSTEKAKAAYQVLQRIENINSGIFQFPTAENQIIANERKVITEKMNGL